VCHRCGRSRHGGAALAERDRSGHRSSYEARQHEAGQRAFGGPAPSRPAPPVQRAIDHRAAIQSLRITRNVLKSLEFLRGSNSLRAQELLQGMLVRVRDRHNHYMICEIEEVAFSFGDHASTLTLTGDLHRMPPTSQDARMGIGRMIGVEISTVSAGNIEEDELRHAMMCVDKGLINLPGGNRECAAKKRAIEAINPAQDDVVFQTAAHRPTESWARSI
jgi:hypothetical protein